MTHVGELVVCDKAISDLKMVVKLDNGSSATKGGQDSQGLGAGAQQSLLVHGKPKPNLDAKIVRRQ